MFSQQCDMWKYIHHSSHLSDRCLSQQQSEPEHPIRYHNFIIQLCINVSIQLPTHSWNIFLLAPCQPQGIRGSLDCVTNSAWISWDAAHGVDSYTVSAVGGENSTASCSTPDNSTCAVEDLACGASYDFTVTAKNSKCESQPSSTISLQTGTSFLFQNHISGHFKHFLF